MFDHPDDVVERAARHLRRPVEIDPALDGRVMREIASLPRRSSRASLRAAWRWLTTPRLLALTPLGGLGAAAVLAALIIGLAQRRGEAPPLPPGPGSRDFQFVVVAPGATQVSLVGDFNDWDATRTPMRRSSGAALWTAVVPLAPGRYRYAYLVDDRRWLPDPAAPAARDDEYGTPSSVLTVGSVGS